jgi:hypothetical protein
MRRQPFIPYGDSWYSFLLEAVWATTTLYRTRSSALRPTPKLKHQVSLFMSPSDRVSDSYPQAPGSSFFVFYDSQDYGGGALTLLHKGH